MFKPLGEQCEDDCFKAGCKYGEKHSGRTLAKRDNLLLLSKLNRKYIPFLTAYKVNRLLKKSHKKEHGTAGDPFCVADK